uniref:Prefoldin subunit n=1 Tax=Strongyloides venezuelensis TaxID=75913 RepID=A0A0K0FUB2_STRVS
MEQFQKTYDKFSEDYQALSKVYERISSEIKDYEELLSTLKLLQEYVKESDDKVDIKMHMNLNEYIFADVKIKENNKVVVKMIENLYAELTYERALIFVEEKIKVLVRYLEDSKKQMAQLQAHMDIYLLLNYELNNSIVK